MKYKTKNINILAIANTTPVINNSKSGTISLKDFINSVVLKNAVACSIQPFGVFPNMFIGIS